jgi:hypothetical protein
MKKIFGISLTVVLGFATAVQAKICVMDQVPAATLLLPYFEVDLDDRNGMTTMFTINNASANSALAKVEIFSDLGVGLFGFTVFLTGYDMQRIDLRDVLGSGLLPQTAPPAGQYPSCNGYLPLAPIPGPLLDHLQKSLTGQPSPQVGNLCSGIDFGDRIARGYVTVDVVSVCTLQYQGDPGYFVSGGLGVPTNDNILWGDYFFLHRDRGRVRHFANGGPLVHIEASASDPETSAPGNYTFYGHFVNWAASDNREPLATTFGVEYVADKRLSGHTDLLVWRDQKVTQSHFTCPATLGARPPWYPLGQELIVVFDEEENWVLPRGNPFPAAAQRTHVGAAGLPFPSLAVPFKAGWVYLNLNRLAGAGAVPPEDPNAAQAWVSPVLDAGGIFNTGYGAIQFDTACDAQHVVQ